MLKFNPIIGLASGHPGDTPQYSVHLTILLLQDDKPEKAHKKTQDYKLRYIYL